ncbi:hypothetical protein AURDEDRAFT_123093 [Auricularia subglabra TFB-10046 SS5]|nr:hypothetical protein AURDEDRAFT_123093 [Auricularia subglabra TFB-10046 SS5]
MPPREQGRAKDAPAPPACLPVKRAKSAPAPTDRKTRQSKTQEATSGTNVKSGKGKAADKAKPPPEKKRRGRKASEDEASEEEVQDVNLQLEQETLSSEDEASKALGRWLRGEDSDRDDHEEEREDTPPPLRKTTKRGGAGPAARKGAGEKRPSGLLARKPRTTAKKAGANKRSLAARKPAIKQIKKAIATKKDAQKTRGRRRRRRRIPRRRPRAHVFDEDEDEIMEEWRGASSEDERSDAFSQSLGRYDKEEPPRRDQQVKGYEDNYVEDYDSDDDMDVNESESDDGDEAYESDPGSTPRHPNGKRLRRYSPRDTKAKPKAKKAKYDHFVEGRVYDAEDVLVSNAVRRIMVKKRLRVYLLLHLFSDELFEQEEDAMVIMPDEDAKQPQFKLSMNEKTADFENWSTWSDRLLDAIVALKLPTKLYHMYKGHFRNVKRKRRFFGTWKTWKAYDIAMRHRVCFRKPPDIAIFDKKYFDNLLLKELTSVAERADDANARAERAVARVQKASTSTGRTTSTSAPRTTSAHGRSKNTASSSTFQHSYDRCILCGSTAHVFDKETKGKKQPCEKGPIWLVWDKSHEVYTAPGEETIICWFHNSREGCHRDQCRLKGKGHRCSFCGDSSHGCHKCPKRP